MHTIRKKRNFYEIFLSSLLGATLFVILLFFPGLVFEGAKWD